MSEKIDFKYYEDVIKCLYKDLLDEHKELDVDNPESLGSYVELLKEDLMQSSKLLISPDALEFSDELATCIGWLRTAKGASKIRDEGERVLKPAFSDWVNHVKSVWKS